MLSRPMLVVALCAAAACMASDPMISVDVAAIGPGSGYDIEPQGHWLLGSQLDLPPFSGSDQLFSVDRATKDGRPITLSVVNDASLKSGTHVGADGWFDGVIVSNGSIELRLTAPTGDLMVTHFRLMRRSTGAAFDTDACGPDGVDAVPLAGVFQSDGLHVASDRITFACGDGVARKCTDWNYPATASPGLRWDAHQACTRMARADYCANGISHTRMETAIKIADSIPGVNALPVSTMFGDVTVWPPDPDQYFFEAAWFPGSHKAGCLTKLRWMELPLGGLCASELPDPRSDPDARSCEDIPLDELVGAGALTFVATAYNDLTLQMWYAGTPGGVDFVTTVRGYHAVIEDRIVRPFADYHTYYYAGTVGYLLRKVPGSIDDPLTDLREVYLFREKTNSRMVLARRHDPRFDNGNYEVSVEREGFVFAWQRPGSVAFRLYRNASGDYVSTVDDAVPAGYDKVDDIGWIMPREPMFPPGVQGP